MYSIHVIILAAIFFDCIDANLRLRHRRQQASGSLYGSSNNPSAGYNYPANTNLYGTNLNNQASKDLYGNPMGPTNPGNSLNMGLPNQQQQQQQQQQQPQQNQQLYGAGGLNPSFSGTGPYSPNNMNNPAGGNMPMRDNNGNIIPQGSQGTSFYSPTNSQVGYPGSVNPSLTNKDAYNPAANINPNQYGLNNNNNNNPYPNTNTYVGQQVPNTNNAWPNNNNNNNQYHSNTANTWGQQNRDLNANTANNNNNNNAYSNPNSPYFYNNSAHQMMTSCFVLILSFLLRIYFHI